MLVEFSQDQAPAIVEGDVWLLAKILVLLGMVFYLVFAVLVVRQVQLMTRTVKGDLDREVKIMSWVHFGLAVGVFLFALLFL